MLTYIDGYMPDIPCVELRFSVSVTYEQCSTGLFLLNKSSSLGLLPGYSNILNILDIPGYFLISPRISPFGHFWFCHWKHGGLHRDYMGVWQTG